MVNNHPNIYLHVSCLQTVLVDSLMTIDTQSTDQSVAQQLTTTTHELFTPCSRLHHKQSRETWHSYRRHLLLRNDRSSLRETWLSLPFTLRVFPLQVLTSFCLPQQIKYLILLFTHFDESKNSLELANPTRNIRKCSNKLMTNTFGEINLQSKQDIFCHVAKVKPTTSAHIIWLT